MQGFFSSNRFELPLIRITFVFRLPSLTRWLAVLAVVSTMCPDWAFGQEFESNPARTIVELEDDNGGEELLAAIKSLDETINQQAVLAERTQMRDRLVGFGVIGGACLALLGVLFVYLRMDHATRGFHSGRLQLLAAMISILILATCYFLWTQLLFQ